MRRQIEFKAGSYDGRADRIVAATGTKGRDRPFVIPARKAETVPVQFRMMHLRLRKEGHGTAFSIGLTLSVVMRLTRPDLTTLRAEMAPAMKRALIGVPS